MPLSVSRLAAGVDHGTDGCHAVRELLFVVGCLHDFGVDDDPAPQPHGGLCVVTSLEVFASAHRHDAAPGSVKFIGSLGAGSSPGALGARPKRLFASGGFLHGRCKHARPIVEATNHRQEYRRSNLREKKTPGLSDRASSQSQWTGFLDDGSNYANISVMTLPLSPTVNGRLLGDMTTSSTGRPMA